MIMIIFLSKWQLRPCSAPALLQVRLLARWGALKLLPVLVLSRFTCLTGNDTDMYWRSVQNRDHTATPGTGVRTPGGQPLLNHTRQLCISPQNDLLPHARPFNDRVGWLGMFSPKILTIVCLLLSCSGNNCIFPKQFAPYFEHTVRYCPNCSCVSKGVNLPST